MAHKNLDDFKCVFQERVPEAEALLEKSLSAVVQCLILNGRDKRLETE